MGIDRILVDPTISTQIVEKVVPIKGTIPIGAFLLPCPWIHFADISRTKLRIGLHTHVHLANKTLVGLYSPFSLPLCVLPVIYYVQLAQLFLAFQWTLPSTNGIVVSPCLLVYLRYSMPFFTTNCGFPFDIGLLARSQYFFKVVSDLSFSFNSFGPISRI